MLTPKWTTLEQNAFEKIRAALCSQLVLKLPDFTKSFEIHTYASDVTYGAILI